MTAEQDLCQEAFAGIRCGIPRSEHDRCVTTHAFREPAPAKGISRSWLQLRSIVEVIANDTFGGREITRESMIGYARKALHVMDDFWNRADVGADQNLTATAVEMSDSELARIEALAEAATPGEWFNDCGKIGCGESGIGEMDADADGEFVTAARTAVPKLVAALRSARRAWNEEAKAQAANIRAWMDAAIAAAPAKGEDMLPDSELARIEALAAKARGRFFIRDDGPPDPNHEAIEYINVVFDAVPKLIAALRSARDERNRWRDDYFKKDAHHQACITQRDAAESERDELKEMVELERAENAKRLNTAFERELHALRERDALRAVIEAHACPPDARHHACVGCDLRAAYDAAREGKK